MLLDEPYYADYWSDWSSAKEDSKAALAALAPATVLHDRLVTVAGVRVFGSSFVSCDGLPTRTGFNRTTAEMRAIWSKLPTCDVLLTHTPPRGAGDRTPLGGHDASCAELRDAIAGHACPPKFHVFGHVHTDWGAHKMPATGERDTGTVHINAASVSDYFVLRKDAAIVFDVIPGAARSLRA
uniref:Calcineurin-like phosphoesterase domain-containing protein n=2 Tax=Chrysotila carterae TaxID=13221 RepID=A0A7S4B921_CHRCT|eukprot:6182611-Pleurochrysis_carterae.AAC.3